MGFIYEGLFRGIANLFFGLQCIAGLAFEVDWFKSLTSLDDHFENFASGGVLSKRMPRRNIVRERNERGFYLSYKICQELVVCLSDEVFWTEDLIEETTKGLQDSYTILTLIEHDMSAQLNCSLPNLVPRVFVSYYTCWFSERRRRE